MTLDDACTEHPSVDWLFGDLTPETRARIRAEVQAELAAKTWVKPKYPAIALLVPCDRWVSTHELARQSGRTVVAVRGALLVAKRQGAPLESRLGRGGWRRTESVAS